MSYKIRRMLLIILAGLVIGYLALVTFVYLRQGKMLYFPEKTFAATPHNIGLEYEDITLKTQDNVDISAWFIPAQNARGVVLYFHGNGGNISYYLEPVRIFHQLGMSVLLIDYRGYGKSGGNPSELGTYLDAEAAWHYLVTKRGVPQNKIILFGWSLGTAVAAELALKHQAGALVLESAFTSIPDLGEKFFPHLPVRLISRFKYATINKVGTIKIPKLIIHSPSDEIIPFEHGVKLYEAAAMPKEFLQISGSHNEGAVFSGTTYINGLDAFFSRYF